MRHSNHTSGGLVNYEYDSTNNLTKVDYPAPMVDTTFAYDSDGRRTQMVDATGTTTWTYDNGDRLTALNQPQGNLTYQYDQWGRRTKLTEVAGTNYTNTSYTAHRLTSVQKFPENETTGWVYDTYGRLTRQNNSNGTYALYGHDGLDRLNSLVHKKSDGTVLTSEDYVYDQAGNLTTKTVDGVTTTYGYDNIDQLTSESRTGYVCSYTYDSNGNRLTKTLNGVTETYSYDVGDKLLSRSGLSGTFNYTYDSNGNTKTVTQGTNTTTLNYDAEDRVTSLVVNGVTSSYTYNGLDTRVSKTSGVGGNRTYKRDGAGVTAPVLSDGSATMVPGISERSGGVTRTIHGDRLGTAAKMTNSSQVQTNSRTFDAFGLPISTSNPNASQKGFAAAWGYQEDEESGLKLLGHRFYDTGSGRFINRDPIQSGKNWYVYCGNNPTYNADAEGTDFSQAIHKVWSFRDIILQISAKYHIQPELLAGVLWMESDGNGSNPIATTSNEVASMVKYVTFNKKASIGPFQVTKEPAPNTFSADRFWDYQSYVNDPYATAEDAAKLLYKNASAANRFPGRTDKLNDHELSIAITEYNRGLTKTRLKDARPSDYGKGFLKALSVIRVLLGIKLEVKRQ
ncbi:MAG: RHS repeat-associated core domain-containing protein [Fimbriimonas sp.]